jgi:copper(I)-binding protein
MAAMRALALLLLLLPLPLPVAAAKKDPSSTCVPRISSPWIRMAPASMPMGAAFATISNPCRSDMTIVAVDAQDFDDISLHQTRVVDGVSRMRGVPELVVRAGGRVELRPGGFHLMLSKPRRDLDAGRTVALRFRLKDGRSFSGRFPLRATAP